MKTAHDFLAPFVGAEPGPYLNYADAVKAVQAVIDEAHNAMQDAWVSCNKMEGQPLAEERAEQRRLGRNEMRARLLTMLPRPAELAGGPAPRPNVFPPACPRCTQRPDQCVCPPMFPREEPPF